LLSFIVRLEIGDDESSTGREKAMAQQEKDNPYLTEQQEDLSTMN
jgi:hypothetical protein